MIIDDKLKASFILSFFSITIPFITIFSSSEDALIFPIYSIYMAIIFYVIFFIFPFCLFFIFFKFFSKFTKNYENIFYFLFSFFIIKYLDFYISYTLYYINDYLILRYCIIFILSLLMTFWFTKKELPNI